MLPAEFDSPVSGRGERIRTCGSQNPGWSLPNGSPTHSAGPCDRSRVRPGVGPYLNGRGGPPTRRQRSRHRATRRSMRSRCRRQGSRRRLRPRGRSRVAADPANCRPSLSRLEVTTPSRVGGGLCDRPPCGSIMTSSRRPALAGAHGRDRRPASRGRGARLATGPAPRVPPAWLAAPEEPPEANRQRAVDGDGQSGRP